MSASFDELEQTVQELTTRADDNDQSMFDLQDSIDSSFGDVTQSVQDVQDNLDNVTPDIGQLSFPLSQDTIDLIKEIYPTGLATLVGGTVIINDLRVSVNSNILLTYARIIGTPGVLSYTASSGSFSIQSTQVASPPGTDSSIVSYMILN